ncbi:MAG: fumarylacetoacetate hydrolase family protein [Cyanobacteria bacterium P01_E01_bin.48]
MTPHELAAQQLRNAYENGVPIAPLRAVVAPTDSDGAYQIQAINTEIWQQSGRRVVGHKIGLTSVAVQRQLGVDQPDFGVLFDDMQLINGGVLNASETLQPKVEAEVALVLGSDLFNPKCRPEDIAASTECAVAAIEVVDSRVKDWQITFADTVADNGSSAFFVLGEQRQALAGLDLLNCRMSLEVNGERSSTGSGEACLGNPLNAAAWLVRTLSTRGEILAAGEILLTGALGPMVSINPGDQVRANIDGLGDTSFVFQ